MKKIMKIIVLFYVSTTFGQIPVTDAAANLELTALNATIGSLLSTSSSNKASNAKTLKESLSQGKKMQKGLDKAQKVQEALKKVKSAIKDFQGVKKAVMLMYKTVQDTYFIIYQMNNMEFKSGRKLFDTNDINEVNDDIDLILDKMNDIIDVIQKLMKDDLLKMDDGKRLELILKLNNQLEDNYNLVHRKVISYKTDFKGLIVEPLNN